VLAHGREKDEFLDLIGLSVPHELTGDGGEAGTPAGVVCFAFYTERPGKEVDAVAGSQADLWFELQSEASENEVDALLQVLLVFVPIPTRIESFTYFPWVHISPSF